MGPKGSLRKINKYLELKSNENEHIKMCGKEKEGRKEGEREGRKKGRKEGRGQKKILKDGIFAKVIRTNYKGLPVVKLE